MYGDRIKALRKKLGLSQSELGARLGVTNKAVSKWENGEAYPSTKILPELAKLLGTDVRALLFDGVAPSSADSRPDGRLQRAGEGMQSILSLYKIGQGPSSSHTIGPKRAAEAFLARYPEANSYSAELFGSLAMTGRGHGTDRILRECLGRDRTEILFNCDAPPKRHPNTLEFHAFRGRREIGFMRVYSIGGGDILIEGDPPADDAVYPLRHFTDIAALCKKEHICLWQYAERMEGEGLWDALDKVWRAMKAAMEAGLESKGTLPGGLNVQRKAGFLYHQHHIDESPTTRENRLICAYAYAVSEQNASGGEIVTAPTCGASGVIPAVLRYHQEKYGSSDAEILHALATAGIIGNIIRTNASISGAECGCQAEIGSACSMAAAALGELYGMEIDQIEYAAEIAMEHHLGLTCDPIKGLVQIPCIERNAVAAMRAMNAINLANFLTNTRKISFDLVVETMYETGRDLSRNYRETSEGGLAKLYVSEQGKSTK